MAKRKQPKEWYEIQREFDSMQEMSCVPTILRKVKADFVYDENQSVKWNREWVENNNLRYQQEVARLNTEKNKRRDAIYEDIYYAIQCEVGHDLSRSKAIALWNYAYAQGHAYGIHSIMSCLNEIMELADTLLSEEVDNDKR